MSALHKSWLKGLITLDGRTHEGGGQLLRTSVCLSALTGIPLRVHDIRGNRSGGGGLKAQHLASVLWLAQACDAYIEGAEKGSKTLIFVPGAASAAAGGSGQGTAVDTVPKAFSKKTLKDGRQVWDARLDIGTAGSTGLALQAILPFILFTDLPRNLPVRLTLSGGTNVSGSPSYEYLTKVLLPTLETIGLPGIEAKLERRGWNQGGSSIGSFVLEIPAKLFMLPLPAFSLAPRSITTAERPRRPDTLVATFIAPTVCHQHFRERIEEVLPQYFPPDVEESEKVQLETVCEESRHDKRLYLIIVATFSCAAAASELSKAAESTALAPSGPHTGPQACTYRLAADWLYDRKIDLKNPKNRPHERAAEVMIAKVLGELREECRSGAWVDEHLRDQLVVFQTLADGKSVVWPGRITDKVGEGDRGRSADSGESRTGDKEAQFREPSLHARTAEWVVETMLGPECDGKGGCEGVGFAGAGLWKKSQSSKSAADLSSMVNGLALK
jgi:RNA 3'-terminal phosphate cyclase (ATP)